MTWYLWVLVGSLTADAIIATLTIGQPRKPRTPYEAVFQSIYVALIVWAILAGWQS